MRLLNPPKSLREGRKGARGDSGRVDDEDRHRIPDRKWVTGTHSILTP